jgi:hypothetical protein
MTMLGRIGILALGLLALRSTAAAAAANMSGVWELNVAKSRWGTIDMPSNTKVHMVHNEPKIKWDGMVNYGSEAPREFTFQGAIDGKAYPQSRSYGDGMITMRRVNDYTVESTWKSADGKVTESTRMVISADLKTLTRSHTVKRPDATQIWTEIFEKH